MDRKQLQDSIEQELQGNFWVNAPLTYKLPDARKHFARFPPSSMLSCSRLQEQTTIKLSNTNLCE
jgi:hypothetical protein